MKLAENEQRGAPATYLIRQSVSALFIRLFVLMLLFDVTFALIMGALFIFEGDQPTGFFVRTLVWALYLLKSISQTVVILRLMLGWARTLYYVSEHHLIRQSGILVDDEVVYDLEQMRSVTLHQSWLGKLLNYGDLALSVASSGYRDQVRLQGIMYPRRYESFFQQYLTDSEKPKQDYEEPKAAKPVPDKTKH